MSESPRQRKARFEALAIPCLDEMGRFALSLTRDQEAAQDLVQDAYCRALEKFADFDGRNIRSWLSAIVYSVFINGIRHQKAEGKLFARREDYAADDGETPTTGIEAAEARQARDGAPGPDVLSRLACRDILRAIDALPDEYRMAIVLREENDLSYKEIANVLGCPAGTVMSRLNRGRKMLQTMLKDMAGDMGLSADEGERAKVGAAEGGRESPSESGRSATDAATDGPASPTPASASRDDGPIDLDEYRRRKSRSA